VLAPDGRLSETETTRLRIVLPLIAATLFLAPAAASASFHHVVLPGESLTSIAATDGLSVAELAAANGLSPNVELIAGSTIVIPPQGGSAVAGAPASGSANDAASTSGASVGYVVRLGDTLSAIAARAGTTVAALAAYNGLSPNGVLLAGSTIRVPGEGGSLSTVYASGTSSNDSVGYVVQYGDTLSAIAARAGTTVAALAAYNGLNPNRVLLAGSTIRVPGGGGSPSTVYVSGTTAAPVSSSSADGQPVGAAAEGAPGSPPYPTPERVSAPEIANIAGAVGVPPSLAEAIGWQESGWNNDLVSSAGAVGVMQITHGTWAWINHALNPGAPLAAASAADNVRGGVLMLRALLNSTGGNSALAAAGYYQGLSSVQQNGMYSDTQQYVNDVMALAQRLGGG
jgi:LysM repeat protein